MKLLYLAPDLLEPDPEGAREEPGDVEGLAKTINEQGLLQPLGVVSVGQGRYRIVYGNRRRKAAIQLGLEKVPCILLDADDQDLLLQQLIENVQRQDLNDMEKARAFSRLRSRIIETQGKRSETALDDETGKAVGLTGKTIRRYLNLLNLPQEVQHLIRRGELNVTQAQHLVAIPNPLTQIELARAAVEEGMSAADLSRLSRYFINNPSLTLESALQMLEQGETLVERHGPEVTVTGGPLSKGAAAPAEPAGDDDDIWFDDEEDEAPADDVFLQIEDETIENQPRNKARVFRLRSLDQMVEETDRLSRAYAEGDLVQWVKKDDTAPFKVRLLLKQLDRLVRGLREIVQQQGWEGEGE